MITKDDYKKFKKFLEKYEKYYDQEMIKFIKNNFKTGLSSNEMVDVLRQVYAYLGILSDEKNLYKKCLEKIEEEYDINCNVLEIGSGAIPIFSKYIDEKQKTGTITAYDKYLAPKKLGNIKIYKRNFEIVDNIRKYDLIIGILPCQASKLIIDKANESKKDFFMALCKCTHFNREYLKYNIPTIDDWENYLYQRAEETLPDNKILKIEKLENGYNEDQTIIYVRNK